LLVTGVYYLVGLYSLTDKHRTLESYAHGAHQKMTILPENSGFLPYWLLVVWSILPTSNVPTEQGAQVAAFSALNITQCYKSSKFARRTFDGPASAAEVTPFAGRLFGSWSFLSGLIRIYAAYNIQDRNLYFLALCTYLIVLSHFTTELLIYGTMKIGKGLAPPLFVATTSVVWMLAQWSFYVN